MFNSWIATNNLEYYKHQIATVNKLGLNIFYYL
jgi:hypothetical protein